MNYKGIIALSGGVDSTSLCYHYLSANPSERYLLLHIKLVNGESKQRCKVEAASCQSIIQYLKKNGIHNFDYKVAGMDYESGGEIPPIWDIEAVNFMVGTYMRAFKIHQYIKATSKDDFAQKDFNQRKESSESLLKVIVQPDIQDWEILYPQSNKSKESIIQDLPEELLDLTWSCRQPQYTPEGFEPCGKCHACLGEGYEY